MIQQTCKQHVTTCEGSYFPSVPVAARTEIILRECLLWITHTSFKAVGYLKSNGFHENELPGQISETFSRFGCAFSMTKRSVERRILSVMVMYLLMLHSHVCGWPEIEVLYSVIIHHLPPFRTCKTRETDIACSSLFQAGG